MSITVLSHRWLLDTFIPDEPAGKDVKSNLLWFASARQSEESCFGFMIRIGLICTTTLVNSFSRGKGADAYMNPSGTTPTPRRSRRWRVAGLLAFTAGFAGLVLWLGNLTFIS